MTRQMETFTLQLDELLRGAALSSETPELVFARRLLQADLSPRSRIFPSLRARFFDPASASRSSEFLRVSPNSKKPLPSYDKKPALLRRLSPLKPGLLFGAAMVLLVMFLAWALTNTTPQPAANPTEAPLITPPEAIPTTSTLEGPGNFPATLPGELFFLIRPTTPPFYYQWGYTLAWCAGPYADCANLNMLPALPGGEAIPDTNLSWSPDGTKAIFFGYALGGPAVYELMASTGEWHAIPVEFFVQQEKYFWTTDSQWIAFQAQGEGVYTSYIGFFNLATKEFRKLNEVPAEERVPLGWLNEHELWVQVFKYDPNGGGKQTSPEPRNVRLNVQTGQETEYTEIEGPGPRFGDGSAFLSPDGQWFAVSSTNRAGQGEIFLIRPDGTENHSVFEISGILNDPILWLPDSEHLIVRVYHETTDKNSLHLISLKNGFAQEFFLPGLDTAAFDVSQISLRAVTTPSFGGKPAELFPSPTPYPTHAPTTGDPLTVLQTLTAKYANDMLSGSGWLHLQSRSYSTDDRGTLPNGDPIPNPSISDDWYQLDEQRQVIQAVQLLTDENGKLNQASIQRDGQSINLTSGELTPADPFGLNFDFGFAENAANLVANGQTLRMSDLYADGQYVGVMFNIQIDKSSEWEAVFDPDTGQLRSITLYKLVSGGKQLVYTSSNLVEEWAAEPPVEILAYLEQKLAPYAPLPPIGTPAPEGFDASRSDLTFKWIFGDDTDTPSFFYLDVYAEGYLLGRIDSGGTPGGWCDRSFDGTYIAFNYQRPEPDYLTTLRWYNINDLENMIEPFPNLQQQSPPSFAPGDLRMAFGACDTGTCGYYIYNLQTGELVKLTDGPAYATPVWTPAGTHLAYLVPISDENTDPKRGTVIRVDTGKTVFTGSLDEVYQTYGVTVPTSQSGLACERSPVSDTTSEDNSISNSNVSPALRGLTFKWAFNEDGSAPEIYFGDIYAGDDLLGRADFGEIPGGWCDRSWNGVILAFNYMKDGIVTLRWISLKDVTMFRELPGYDLHSPVTFAPNDFRLAFMGCQGETCGVYVFDIEQNETTKISDDDPLSPLLWSPNGQFLVFWYGDLLNEQGVQNAKVVNVGTGEVLYNGDPTLEDSPLASWGLPVQPVPMTGPERCEAPPETLSSRLVFLSSDGTYTVQEGDSLASIANYFGLAIDVLLGFNGLSPDAVLSVGQVLIVAPPITNP